MCGEGVCSEGGGVCGEGVEDECAVKEEGCVVRVWKMSVQ